MDIEHQNEGCILVVDDEEGAREALGIILEDEFRLIFASNGREALEILRMNNVNLVMLDLNLPDMNGLEVLERIREYDEDVDIIMVSAIDSATKAVDSLKLGAYDYITKPFEPDDILMAVNRVIDKQRLKKEIEYLREELSSRMGECEVLTRNRKMLDILDVVKKVSNTPSTVLIYGESGTGKELIARAIHENGSRANAPFVAVNCGAIPSELMESEFFGHEKGAFTGAGKRRLGKFEFADGGTLFLDEVSTLPQLLQVKLLRVLQERKIERVGSNLSIRVDVRIIAATNTNLKEEVRKGKFRGDLFYRLNVLPIHIPPLRDRKDDIPLLAQYFLKKFNMKFNKKVKGFSSDSLEVLMNYYWPGNVRELENLVERMVVLMHDGDTITLRDLPVEVFAAERMRIDGTGRRGLKDACQLFERQYILECLKRTGWNQTQTARLLRIHRNTLLFKMKILGINLEPSPGSPS